MRRFVLSTCLALNCLLPLRPALADPLYQARTVKGSFAEVKESVVTAIEGRGLVINATSHIGDMLRRTGSDLGQAAPIFVQAEMLEFCSAGASRAMMAVDPGHIVFCPFGISLYTLPGESEQVHIAIRPLPANPAFKQARELIAGILKDALE